MLAFLGEQYVYMSDFNFEAYFSISVIEANKKFVKKNVSIIQKFVDKMKYIAQKYIDFFGI